MNKTKQLVFGAIALMLLSGCTQPAQTNALQKPGRNAGQAGGMEKDLPIAEALEKMKADMEKNGGSVSPEPVAADQDFQALLVLSRGEFRNINYRTTGSAGFVTDGESNAFIELGTDFSTPNGPDLVIYLTKNSQPSTRADITAGLELGELKSTTGKQVYALPAGTSADEYHSVTIHCRKFNIPWSYAPLERVK